MALSPLTHQARSASALAASALGNHLAEMRAKEETQAEINQINSAPANSAQPTLAQLRRQFLQEQTGQPWERFECEGEILYTKRLSFGEVLYLTLLLPLTPLNFLDPSRPDELSHAMAETLRLGLMRVPGTLYFENKADAASFVSDGATAQFAATCILAIDRLNRIFPRPSEAPKTLAQQRLERMRDKEAPKAKTPAKPRAKRSGTAPAKAQPRTPSP